MGKDQRCFLIMLCVYEANVCTRGLHIVLSKVQSTYIKEMKMPQGIDVTDVLIIHV